MFCIDRSEHELENYSTRFHYRFNAVKRARLLPHTSNQSHPKTHGHWPPCSYKKHQVLRKQKNMTSMKYFANWLNETIFTELTNICLFTKKSTNSKLNEVFIWNREVFTKKKWSFSHVLKPDLVCVRIHALSGSLCCHHCLILKMTFSRNKVQWSR